jgi:hypothetical protein
LTNPRLLDIGITQSTLPKKASLSAKKGDRQILWKMVELPKDEPHCHRLEVALGNGEVSWKGDICGFSGLSFRKEKKEGYL